MENDKKTCIIYNSWASILRNLPDDKAGEMIKKLVGYAFYNEEIVSEDPLIIATLRMMAEQIDKDTEKYNKKCETLKSNRQKTNQTEIKKKSKRNQDDIKSVSDSVSVSDIDTKEKSKRETADAVVNLYHECCPSLPKVSKLNDHRRKAINARLEEYTMEELREIFTKAEHSNFLKEGAGTWTGANFDWIMNPTNICKIAEGNYSNKEEKKEEEETRPVVGYILNDEYMMAPCYDKEEYERFMRERYGE